MTFATLALKLFPSFSRLSFEILPIPDLWMARQMDLLDSFVVRVAQWTYGVNVSADPLQLPCDRRPSDEPRPVMTLDVGHFSSPSNFLHQTCDAMVMGYLSEYSLKTPPCIADELTAKSMAWFLPCVPPKTAQNNPFSIIGSTKFQDV